MLAREICPNIEAIVTAHWERRLFDSLIPLPDGTSYNAYLLKGSTKTALIDSSDPALRQDLLEALEGVDSIDYLVSLHSEQDHSGLLPELMQRYPKATLLCSKKAEDILVSHLAIDKERVRIVEDGESLSLGDLSLEFIYTPWVHWPETMCAYVPQRKCLLSCDLFGSHLATSDLFAVDKPRVYEAAKRYYAEIMMPFRSMLQKNLVKLADYEIDIIAPSHGPCYNEPAFIVEAYNDWVGGKLKNEVVIPYISMHGSTEKMVRRLTQALVNEGVSVRLFDLTVTDIGQLAITLVDAASIVVASPTVQVGSHPIVGYATALANSLKPRVKYAAVLASYGWASKAIEQIAAAIPALKVEVLATILQKGLPDQECYAEIDRLAAAIAKAHREDDEVQC